MINLVQEGKTITVKATADVAPGEIFQEEAINGIYVNSAKNGDDVAVSIEGVYELEKDNGAIGFGKKVYISASGKATATEAGGKFFGVATKPALAGDTVVHVKIYPAL